MPLSIIPFSRRKFLKSTLAIGAGALLADSFSFADEQAKTVRFSIFSDPHIATDANLVQRGVNMTTHLTTAVAQAAQTKASTLLINGDLAWKDGQPGDYSQFLATIKPLLDAGVVAHMSLGNHDHRENFWKALPPGAHLVDGRQVTIVESAPATWIILDTLDKTDVTPGLLGAAQLKWLKEYLDQHADKKILVMTHHHPERAVPTTQPGATKSTNGIVDGPALMEILLPRKQVKALVIGHQHRWGIKKDQGLHLVNLPAVSYVFSKDQPSGWTDWVVSDQGCEITLNTIDPKHPAHQTKTSLSWRSA